MILDLILPNRCLHCSRIIDGHELICNLCFEHVHFTHYEFTGAHYFKEKCSLLFPVKNAFALMQFEKENLSRKIIHTLKYKNREIVGKILADWTADRLNFGKDKPDLMVTVPLHPKKLRERGYNQLHTFADILSEYFTIPVDHEYLKRNKHSKAQALKDKQHRLDSENSFSVQKKLTGKHILLIDDVFTTGNTISSIAWEIIKNGGNTVSVLVMAMDE